jgi:hypothetical protein
MDTCGDDSVVGYSMLARELPRGAAADVGMDFRP